MRKIVCALLVCAATLSISSAKALGLGILTIKSGVKGGLSLYPSNPKSSTDFPVDGSMKYNVGYHFGVMTRLEFIHLLYVQPEIVYNHAAYDLTLPTSGTTKLTDNTISVPVLGGVHFAFFRVYAGPVFNIANFGSGDSKYFSNVTITRPSVGYQAGVGFSLLMLDVDLRLNGTGIRPTQSLFPKTGNRQDVNLTRNNIMLSVGVSF